MDMSSLVEDAVDAVIDTADAVADSVEGGVNYATEADLNFIEQLNNPDNIIELDVMPALAR